MKKLLVVSLALTALAAGPAAAQAPHLTSRPAAPEQGYPQQAPQSPNDVMVNGRLAGRDPDPFVRNELRRHFETGWPAERTGAASPGTAKTSPGAGTRRV
jgi:hypothetical protein